MATFAKVNNNLVEKVIVAESSFFDTFIDSSPGEWIETSDQIRGHYAGIGYSYDPATDSFMPQKPYPSWVLDGEGHRWVSPIPYPDDGKDYIWDEVTHWSLAYWSPEITE